MKQCSLLVFVLFICATHEAKLPSNFRVCKRSDPNLKSCLKSVMQETFSKLDKGIPEIGAPSIEPLVVPSATIGEGQGAVNVVQKYKNFSLHKLSTSTLENVEATFGEKDFNMTIDFSSLQYIIEAEYDFNGRILLLPIVGNGKCNLIFDNVKGQLYIAGKTIEKKGKDYLNVEDCKLTINAGKITYNFENLFNGNERLGKEMNNLLNENWKDVFEDVRPGYEEVLANVFKSYIKNIFLKAPYDTLVPK